LFDPKSPEFARVLQADQVPNIQAGVADPTLGLNSETLALKGATAEQPFLDGVTDVVLARRPLTDFDQLVKDWRDAGGDQIRHQLWMLNKIGLVIHHAGDEDLAIWQLHVLPDFPLVRVAWVGGFD